MWKETSNLLESLPECVFVSQCFMIAYLCGCQEGKHKEDCSERYHLRSSLALQHRIDRQRKVEHEEAQQVLCGHQP